jgi:hypothetical protein
MNDDLDQDPEDRSPELVEPEEDIDSPLYHAPNSCADPSCMFPQCSDSGAVGRDKYPGEDIWWKTIDKRNNS